VVLTRSPIVNAVTAEVAVTVTEAVLEVAIAFQQKMEKVILPGKPSRGKTDPDVDSLPVKFPEQAVALTLLQLTVVLCPAVTDSGLAEMVTVGSFTSCTLMVTVAIFESSVPSLAL
jgi:hypothetical protein